MQFLHVSKVFLLASLARAFALPQPDGAYVLMTDTSPNVAINVLDKRQQTTSQLFCSCGNNVDINDTNQAVAELKSQLSRAVNNKQGIAPNQSIYVVRGNMVAFQCSRPIDSRDAVITSSETYSQLLERITNSCGHFVPGTALLSQAGQQGGTDVVLSGYMRYTQGMDVCGEATRFQVSRC